MTLLNESTDVIENIEFEKISWKMNESGNCSLTADEIELAIEEYKRFLTLKSQNPIVRLAPTELMDEVWHFHILDTARYAADCHAIFGQFLHHSPSYGPFESEEKQSSLQESFERMVGLYCERFGHDPITRMGSCSSACSGVACE
jgi:hypothetical protein